MSKHILEIHRNTDDSSSAYLTPEGEDCGYRIAGPKSWGDSWLIEELEVSDGDLIQYIRGYAPNVLSELASRECDSSVLELVEALEGALKGRPMDTEFWNRSEQFISSYRNRGGKV